ncbi:hypothetical protein NEF87_003703 [Candidatus Lokiarchaeum ossiferum]|uniref:Uncharacterized protein n=1 Tax=Candidatus Lokiarchaeum ossiferum TaxID=2951803 RepID=A0ABY6HVQ6_9ARCH|nr:hypothetical protein NEF87_003703 [Candidatus Lokiarchaeum sp. B-35]
MLKLTYNIETRAFMTIPLKQNPSKISQKTRKMQFFYLVNIILILALLSGIISCLNVIVPNQNRTGSYSDKLEPGDLYLYPILPHDNAFSITSSSQLNAVFIDPSQLSLSNFSSTKTTYQVTSERSQTIRFYCPAGSNIILDFITGHSSLEYKLSSDRARSSQPSQTKTGSIIGGFFLQVDNVTIPISSSAEHTLELKAPRYSSQDGRESGNIKVELIINRAQYNISNFDELQKISGNGKHSLDENDIGKTLCIINRGNSDLTFDLEIFQDLGIYWILLGLSLILIIGLLRKNEMIHIRIKTIKSNQNIEMLHEVLSDLNYLTSQENLGTLKDIQSILIEKLSIIKCTCKKKREYSKWFTTKKGISVSFYDFHKYNEKISETIAKLLYRISNRSHEPLIQRVKFCHLFYKHFHENLGKPIITNGWFAEPLTHMIGLEGISSSENMHLIDAILAIPCKLMQLQFSALNSLLTDHFQVLNKTYNEDLPNLLKNFKEFAENYPNVVRVFRLDIKNEIKVIEIAIKLQVAIQKLSIEFNHAHILELVDETGCSESVLELNIPRIISYKLLDIKYDSKYKRVKFNFDIQEEIDDLVEKFEDWGRNGKKKI